MQNGQTTVLDEISLAVGAGETVGVLGESGSGKTVLIESLVDLVEPPGAVTAGEIWVHAPALADRLRDERPASVDGDLVDLRQLSDRDQRRLRRSSIRIIIESAEQAFNPVLTIGDHFDEALAVDRPSGARPAWLEPPQRSRIDRLLGVLPGRTSPTQERRQRAIRLLERGGIPDPETHLERRSDQLPPEIRRRLHILEAIATGPAVLLADEPTQGLSEMERRDLLALLDEFSQETDMAILLCSTDPAVIAHFCDRVAILYGGTLVEEGPVNSIFTDPSHPSTRTLLANGKLMDS